jgi:hypothetical protein
MSWTIFLQVSAMVPKEMLSCKLEAEWSTGVVSMICYRSETRVWVVVWESNVTEIVLFWVVHYVKALTLANSL